MTYGLKSGPPTGRPASWNSSILCVAIFTAHFVCRRQFCDKYVYLLSVPQGSWRARPPWPMQLAPSCRPWWPRVACVRSRVPGTLASSGCAAPRSGRPRGGAPVPHSQAGSLPHTSGNKMITPRLSVTEPHGYSSLCHTCSRPSLSHNHMVIAICIIPVPHGAWRAEQKAGGAGDTSTLCRPQALSPRCSECRGATCRRGVRGAGWCSSAVARAACRCEGHRTHWAPPAGTGGLCPAPTLHASCPPTHRKQLCVATVQPRAARDTKTQSFCPECVWQHMKLTSMT